MNEKDLLVSRNLRESDWDTLVAWWAVWWKGNKVPSKDFLPKINSLSLLTPFALVKIVIDLPLDFVFLSS